ncbi:MAG: DUF3990 domain-containing protein [Propionibacteriaceae bacterium]|jgi:hypothetical protein|nr:DUF3990 domain-containing protein [Propionibacteriaceae bacterium]
MILFHGSNMAVEAPDLSRCRPFKDFGRGFYLTENRTHAERMGARTARIYGSASWVSVYSLDEDTVSDLSFLRFDGPTPDWAEFVMNNRSRRLLNAGGPSDDQDVKYDLVVGPVADDDIALLLMQFQRGWLDSEALTRLLVYRELSIQHSFHTERGLAALSFVEATRGQA